MGQNLSDECKKKIKELEEKLVWSIKIIKDSDFPYLIIPEHISFLALSCRFSGQSMDADCKKVISGYEEDIINLKIRITREQISGLEDVHTQIKKAEKG